MVVSEFLLTYLENTVAPTQEITNCNIELRIACPKLAKINCTQIPIIIMITSWLLSFSALNILNNLSNIFS
jgi:hypothetical protein